MEDKKEIIEAEVVEDKTEFLNKKEKSAYEFFLSRKNRKEAKYAPLAPEVSARLFTAYLNGTSMEELAKHNKQFNLGQIVHAAVEHNWKEQKDNYAQNLMEQVAQRAAQVQAEGIMFLADQLAAAHKLHGEKAKKYLQSGKIEDLGPMAAMNIKAYKELVELFQKMTGQEGVKTEKVTGEVTHKHTHVMIPTQAPEVAKESDETNLLESWAKESLKKKEDYDS